jgi:hydroxymethylpyrimidine/phosphomethylpyrimidine kinase
MDMERKAITEADVTQENKANERGGNEPLYQYPRILSIAGSDSGGGAGIQADLKTFSALGCFGMTAITAITAQNTCGVDGIHAVPAPMLAKQIDAVVGDIGVDAVKIGMLHDPDVVNVVAEAIRRYRWQHVVLDPVMVAAGGDRLIAEETVAVLVRELFPLATVITPNLDEAALLLGRAIRAECELAPAAHDLINFGAQAVLLKGGHLPGTEVVDLLLQHGKGLRRMASPRIISRNTHGTGCTLSSAIACHLGLGHTLDEAVQLAREYVIEAIASGAGVKTGRGQGPLNHAHAPRPMQKFPLPAD